MTLTKYIAHVIYINHISYVTDNVNITHPNYITQIIYGTHILQLIFQSIKKQVK